jgi:quercetin dioxygenase-like cupin family protein
MTRSLAAPAAVTDADDSTAEPIRLAWRYAHDPASWPVQPRFDAASRWYSLLHRDERYEAWLLTWLPGQTTDLHDHGGASGALTVISGTITEDVIGPRRTPRLTTLTWPTGQIRGFGPHHVHRVHNATTDPAVTLHVYAPGLTAMTRYAFTDGRLATLGVDRAGTDW